MYLELKCFSNLEKSFYSLIFSILSTLFGNLSEKIIPNHKYGDIKSLGRDSDVRTSFKRHLFAGCEVCRNIKWKESISPYISQGKHLPLCCLSHDKQLELTSFCTLVLKSVVFGLNLIYLDRVRAH